MIKIGNRKFDTNIFLAPLAGCSDMAFRLMCREYGAGMAFFEMISSNALVHGRTKTESLLKTVKKDNPVAGQLLGSDPVLLEEAAFRMLELAPVKFIDINVACPVKKVVNNGQGAALLEKPRRLYSILKRLSKKIPVPVTVKMRIGFNSINIVRITRIARKCEEKGASALFVHGRTRAQFYSGTVNYDVIKRIKEAVTIPVFGSGDVLTPSLAKKMFDETGCDGILVARGAFGSPWIFRDIDRYFKTGQIPIKVHKARRLSILKKHLSYVNKYTPAEAYSKLGFMRKVALWYIKDFAGAAKGRGRAAIANSYEEMLKIVDKL